MKSADYGVDLKFDGRQLIVLPQQKQKVDAVLRQGGFQVIWDAGYVQSERNTPVGKEKSGMLIHWSAILVNPNDAADAQAALDAVTD